MKNIKRTIVILGSILAIAMMIQGVIAQPPPPVTIQGDVVYAANGSRVPNGWIVSITDTTTGFLLGTGTTFDMGVPAIPQYEVQVDLELIVVGHVIEAYSESPDGTFMGTATHTVVAGDDTQGATITMPDVNVSANAPPSVSVTTPSWVQHGDVQINYTLSDAESDICSIEVQFKGGLHPSWTDATTIGTTTGLSSSPSGVNHTITWQSGIDATGEDDQFQIKITPSDTAVGTAGNTSLFNVDNKAPTITFVPPTPDNDAEVEVRYVFINVSVPDDDISVVTLDWNGTNYTMFSLCEGYYYYNNTGLPNGLYTYKVYANDTSDNWNVSETRNVIVNVSEEAFEIPLNTGWNLIAIPVEVENTAIDAVFPNAHNLDKVYFYDSGTWRTATYYDALLGWYSTTGLTTIEPDKGYWYSATEAYTITGTGTVPATSSVPIVSGWNLIDMHVLRRSHSMM